MVQWSNRGRCQAPRFQLQPWERNPMRPQIADQPGLFQILEQTPRARARRRDPDTSKAAARSVPVADLEAQVLEVLRRFPGGLTSHEVAKILKVELVSVSPRFSPLAKKNLVLPTTQRRRGPSGRTSIVWKAV